MKKYQVFRSFGSIDRSVKRHVLVAVEYGKDIDDVTDKLIKAVNNDVTGLEKYQRGYTAESFAPERVREYRRVKRYAYVITPVLLPEYGEHNDIIEYGLTEEAVAG